jgi:archaellum component FlaF (FlaF/FlaG flagellin family)
VNTSWNVRLWADGVLAHEQQVDAGVAPVGVPTLLEATVNLPRITADHRFTLHLEPVFLVDQAVEFTIAYDSTQPCAATSAGACDSVVEMPVVSEGEPTVPDLVVQSVSAVEGNGNRSTIRATIANVGTTGAAATRTRFVLDGQTVLGVLDTPVLSPGQTADVSVDWNTAGVSGEHRIEVTADDGTAVAESDEANNVGTLSVTVKGNKVRNGSFEQSSNGTAPDNWSSSGNTTYEQGGSDGDRSVSAGPGGTWTSDAIDVEPGAGYELSAAVAGAAGGIQLAELSATGQVLRTLDVPLGAVPGGVFGIVTQAVSVGADTSAVRVRLSGPLLGTARFDAVTLREQ